LKGEIKMKVMTLKESIASALLMMIALSALAGMTASVCAAKIKDPTIYITGSGSIELTWKSGTSQTFSSNGYANLGGLYNVAITPTHGWHILEVLIDGNPQDIIDEDGFSLINPKAKNMISASFLENPGIDDVDTGSNVEAYPDPLVGLIFDTVLTAGDAYAYTIGLQQLPPGVLSELWDIQTDALFDEGILIIITINLVDAGSDPTTLTMLRTEYSLARADVNLDGVVDGTDVSIIANVNPSELGDPNYDPWLDLDDNNVINDDDVNMANDYNGEIVWDDITLEVVVDYDLGLVYIYGVTDHLSLFGIHKKG